MKHARRALVAALLVYGIICIRDPNVYRILDSVDLPIHEAGHLVFAPFGDFLQFLGGTVFQLLVPIAFVAKPAAAAPDGAWYRSGSAGSGIDQ